MRQKVKGKLGIRVLTAFLSLAMLVTMTPLTAGTASAAEDPAKTDTDTLKLAILSDIHYVSKDNRLNAETDGFKDAELTEMRMMKEIGAILDEALLEAGETNPDAMLVCGDLCSNGEQENESELATTLANAETDDTQIYVINGNHDINNSYSAHFTSEGVRSAPRTKASVFKDIYNQLGYSQNTRYYKDPGTTGEDIANYGGLSYATEIQDGVTLIALDTAQYSASDKEYNKAQITAGTVSDDLLAWAKQEAEAAKSNGNLVLAMCHHSIIPHYSVKNATADAFFAEYLVPNWEHVAGTLADAGVSAILTGHSHANDISQHTTEKGNTIYDIQTAALCAYPCAWRTLNITIDKSGDQPSYSFDIETHFIEGSKAISDVTGGYEYDGKKHTNLQGYSFNKTGVPEGSIPRMIGYFIRSYLYDIKTHDNGFQGYLQEQLSTEETKVTDVGEYATDKVAELIDGVEPITQEFSFFGTKYKLKITRDNENSTKLQKKFDVNLYYGAAKKPPEEVTLADVKIPDEIKLSLEEMVTEQKENPEKDYVQITKSKDGNWTIKFGKDFPEATKNLLLTLAGIDPDGEAAEHGVLTIDLSGFAKGVNNGIDQANTDIKGKAGDWADNYKRTEIEKEASKVIVDRAVPIFTTPLREKDGGSVAPIFIARDAFQAFARGDEGSVVPSADADSTYQGMTAAKLTEKRKEWNELVQGDEFAGHVKKNLLKTLSGITDESDYPTLSSLMKTELAPEGGKLIVIVPDAGSTTIGALGSLLGDIRAPKDAISVLGLLDMFGVDPLSGVSVGALTGMFAEAQVSLTTDTNIEEDSKWDFHTVTFDPQGGKVSVPATMTVDGHKAGVLPTPTKEGVEFLGWFAKGKEVTKDTSLEGISTLYAQWDKYVVTFLDGQGREKENILKTEAVEKGKAATAPEKPVRPGYTFTGWDTDFSVVTSDLTVIAQWKQSTEKYTVTFEDGQGNMLKEQEVVSGGSATAPEAPVREGYVFAGWDKDFSNVTEDLTVNALWKEESAEADHYTVVFVFGFGNDPVEQTVEKGTAAVEPEPPTVDGFTFTGWDKDFSSVTENLTVTAQWKKNNPGNEHTVVFVDGYSVNPVSILRVPDGNAAKAPDDPVRPGYSFTGWDTDFSHVTSNLTVLAQWKQGEFTVTFEDGQGNVIGEPQKVLGGNSAQAPEDPTREGYVFAGWDKDFNKVVSDLTVTAQWKKLYTVIFEDGQGNAIGEPQKVASGDPAKAPADPSREGYAFDGWDKDFSKVTEDLTVKAQWKKLFTVTFEDGQGKVLDTQTVIEGKSAKAPANPTREGYAFAGWDEDFSKVTKDLTVKAKWDKLYRVNFEDGEGNLIDTQAVAEGKSAKAPANPTKEGYTFTGWDKDFSKVTEDLTVIAQWKKSATPVPVDRSKQTGTDGTAFGPGAAIEAAEAALAKMTSDKDPKGTKIAPLLLKSTKQTKKSIKLSWKKAPGAKKYIVYGNLCGKTKKVKKLLTTTKTSYNVKKAGKKLKKGKYYKFMVIAVDAKNNVVSSSKIIHVATSGSKKAANAKKVIVKAKVSKSGKKLKKWKQTSKITLRAGSTPKRLVKTTKLKATFTKAKKSKVKKHVGMRYQSSNPKIATVSSAGKVTAKKKGSCKIYVYAQNGLVKTVKVTVK